MRRSDIIIGNVYAVSDQRDATIGSAFWSFYPARVLEKNVEREENIHGEPTQRTDGVKVEVLDTDGNDTGEQRVVRTREVKGDWDEHVRLLAENERKSLQEAQAAEQERLSAQDQAQTLTGGTLSHDQVIQVTPEVLERAQTMPVEVTGQQGLLKVIGPRQDALVLVLEKDVWLGLLESQNDRGHYALRIPRVQVVQGPDDVTYVVAAALFAHRIRTDMEVHEEHRGFFQRILTPAS